MALSMTGIKQSVMKAAHQVEAKAKANPKATLAIGAGAVVVYVITLAIGPLGLAISAFIVALAVAKLIERNPKIFNPLLSSIRDSIRNFWNKHKPSFKVAEERDNGGRDRDISDLTKQEKQYQIHQYNLNNATKKNIIIPLA